MNPILTGNLILLALVALLLLFFRQVSPPHRAVGVILAVFSLELAGLEVALLLPPDRFGSIQMLAWLVFCHNAILLLGVAAIVFRRSPRAAAAALLLAAGLLLLAADGFLIEPRALEVSGVTISSSKVTAPLRIALVADLQTDTPGDYEGSVLARVKAERPDLILFAGDFAQADTDYEYTRVIERLRVLFSQAGLSAPLGIYTVQGNTDRPGRWQVIFDGLPVTPLETTTRLDLGPLVLTGLSMQDSFRTGLTVPGEEKFHIVLGHSPNYSLGHVSADLLLAGHTHGGQMRLPLLGPLVTLSSVPRSWGAGVTAIGPGKTLIVSRGVGLERHSAPRLRLNCRPELVMIEIRPE